MCKYRKVYRSLFLSYLLWGFSLLSGGLLISCSKENSSGLSVEEGGELRLGAAIASVSRATDAGFEVDDTLGVYITKWKDAATPDTLKESGNYADNVFFQLESLNNNWLPEYSVYYPSDDNKIDLYAYYPYRPSSFISGTSLSLTVASDQSVSNRYTRSDFMTAKTVGVIRTANKVPLVFDHRLSQIVFVLKPGAGFSVSDLLPARIRIVNAIVDGTYDLKDTLPVSGSTRSDVIPAGSWIAGSESLTGMKAILIPQELTPETYVEIRLGNRRFTYRPSSVHLNPGCSRTFTITVNNTGLDITTTINPWDSCPPVNGDANEEFDVIVSMTTLRQDPTFTVEKNGDIVVDWGDGIIDTNKFNHIYTDRVTSHTINFYGATDALTELYCQNNQLSSLDIKNNLKLENLSCSNNQLTKLDVNKNILLKYLDCKINQLNELYLNNNKILEELSCQNNKLVTLDLSYNIALKDLSCGNNQLTELDVYKNTLLESFSCSRNYLSTLDLSKNQLLQYLYCYGNQLDSLDLSNNKELAKLECNQNRLVHLDLSNNILLIYLICDDNPFIIDQFAVKKFADLLPDKTGIGTGRLIINDSASVKYIQEICSSKNWIIIR